MIRETREEAGLAVIPETVREYGYVHRIHTVTPEIWKDGKLALPAKSVAVLQNELKQ